MVNPYTVLGVANGSSKEDCKKAWKTLSKKYHPDNGGNKDLFDEVQKAWKMIQGGVNLAFAKRSRLRHITLFTFEEV